MNDFPLKVPCYDQVMSFFKPQQRSWGGDPGNQGQWNPAIGKPNPKIANQNPAAYGGVDDLNWNLPKVGQMSVDRDVAQLKEFYFYVQTAFRLRPLNFMHSKYKT